MKKYLLLLTASLTLTVGCNVTNAQGTWTQKTNFSGTARFRAACFSISTKGYIGTGGDGVNQQAGFWEYDQATDTWTQKADFAGGYREGAVGFAINNKGYIGTGRDIGGNYFQDFWEWNQITNTWTQKNNFGGTVIGFAVGFSIGTKGYIGTGVNNSGRTQDFWEWDQATDTWTQMANFGGTARYGAIGFSIGTKGYIGTGWDGGFTQDFWEWDQGTNVWSQKANYAGTARSAAVGFSIAAKGYIGTGYDAAGNTQDFWEWDQGTNVWSQKANYSGVARNAAVGFSIGTKGYIGLGSTANGVYSNDFSEFSSAITPSICLVTVDSLSKYNIIVWDKTLYSDVDSFIIYREYTTNNYMPIGAVPYDSLSQFIDTVRIKYFPITGDPNISSYRYKLQIRDTTGNYGALSLYHNTVHMVNNSGNFQWNLYTIENSPNPVTFYILKRDTLNNGNWNTVAGVSGTQNSITDPQYSSYQNTANWRIETQWGISCTPTRIMPGVTTTMNTSRSNALKTNTNGINEILKNNSIIIFPNPVSTQATLSTDMFLKNAQLTIYNSVGQTVKHVDGLAGQTVTFNRDNLPSGLYFVRLTQDGNTISADKFVITDK